LGYLVAAVLAPALGPVLYALLHGHERAVRVVDGFVYVAVPVLVAWQVVPFALERGGWLVIAVVGAGLLVPTLFERLSHAFEHRTDDLAILVGMSGLGLHALLEGAALVPVDGAVAPAFGWAVVLHRVPVALVIWWLLRPRHGIGIAAIGVGALIAATVLGYVAGAELLSPVHGPGTELYQAFVSGSLIHVVFHQGRRDHDH